MISKPLHGIEQLEVPTGFLHIAVKMPLVKQLQHILENRAQYHRLKKMHGLARSVTIDKSFALLGYLCKVFLICGAS